MITNFLTFSASHVKNKFDTVNKHVICIFVLFLLQIPYGFAREVVKLLFIETEPAEPEIVKMLIATKILFLESFIMLRLRALRL